MEEQSEKKDKNIHEIKEIIAAIDKKIEEVEEEMLTKEETQIQKQLIQEMVNSKEN